MTALEQYKVDTGLTNVQIAKELGVTGAYVGQLSSGKKVPRLRLAMRIEEFTGGAVPANSWFKVQNSFSGNGS